MPRNSFVVSVEGLAELNATLTALPDSLKPYIKEAAGITAAKIRDDAQERLLRQLSGTSTGETVRGILVNPDRSGWGWVVDAGNLTTPMLDRWLERGTRNMAPRAFFYSSALLEEQAHRERVSEAIRRAIHDKGLGE